MSFDRRQLLIAAAASALPLGARAAEVRRTAFTYSEGKIHAPVRIKGIDVIAVLDSGAKFHAMDTRLARDFAIPASGKISVAAIGGAASAKYSDPIDIGLAGKDLPQSQFAVLDLAKYSQNVGQPIDMIIGAPLFNRFFVDLDFAGATLALGDPSDFATPESGAMLPLTSAAGRSSVEVLIGDGSVQATVDTGSDEPLILSPSAAEKLGVLKKGPSSTRLVTGLGGARIGRIATVPALTLAGQDFTDVPVVVAPAEFGSEANVGCGLLSQFHVGLDFPEGWLLLSDRRTLPFKRDLTGLRVTVNGTELKIIHVAQGSPAQKAGFRVGERVTQIDGQPAATANIRLADASPGRTVAFTLAGGKTRNLTLARFY